MNASMKRITTISARYLLALFLCLAAGTVLLPMDAAAQESGADSEPESDKSDEAASASDEGGEGRGATTFEPASAEEEVSGLGLMVAAYMAIWVLLVGYFVVLYNRQKRIGKDLDELKLRVEALDDLD